MIYTPVVLDGKGKSPSCGVGWGYPSLDQVRLDWILPNCWVHCRSTTVIGGLPFNSVGGYRVEGKCSIVCMPAVLYASIENLIDIFWQIHRQGLAFYSTKVLGFYPKSPIFICTNYLASVFIGKTETVQKNPGKSFFFLLDNPFHHNKWNKTWKKKHKRNPKKKKSCYSPFFLNASLHAFMQVKLDYIPHSPSILFFTHHSTGVTYKVACMTAYLNFETP
jgi:hypothetical protein